MTIALVGNPNCGKTSLFNTLTGALQKVGNYPGVTVDIYEGVLEEGTLSHRLLDLPGTYSMYPTAQDERVAVRLLLGQFEETIPGALIYVVDVTQLERQLLLFTQVRDLGYPIVLVVNLMGLDQTQHNLDLDLLRSVVKVPLVTYDQKEEAATCREKILSAIAISAAKPYTATEKSDEFDEELTKLLPQLNNPYQRRLMLHHQDWLGSSNGNSPLGELAAAFANSRTEEQVNDTMKRLSELERLAPQVVQKDAEFLDGSEKFDRILTHNVWGPIIFVALMLFVFQAIFAWSSWPMDGIEAIFGSISGFLQSSLPEGLLTRLLTEGILPGLAGVLVFVPQIAILFFLIVILEEIGYMARAVYLFDNLLQRFGMNGRSIVALISGGACAIPAIMTTRTISDWKERMITIFVTPFISCSARIPVYTLLIAFVVPYERVGYLFNSQGLAFAGLYLLGIIAALGAGWVLKKVLKSPGHSVLAMELPRYQYPKMKTVLNTVGAKVWVFIREAGQVILVVSIVLWFLASFGPAKQMAEADSIAQAERVAEGLSDQDFEKRLASLKMERSFAGQFGHAMEPIIAPLGFDWRMGIGLLSAFAAREVFVGAMATLYSVGEDSEENRLRQVLAKQKNPDTGEPLFNFASSLSLLLFFVFAMQCVSTLAVVKAETNSWKWPLLQFFVMTLMAYMASLAAYQIFS